MNVKTKHKPYLKALAGLRFFAAIYIVLFHHAQLALTRCPEYIHRLSQYGYVSVSLFFVLSGFILAYTYLDYKNELSVPLRRFWIARFSRIYPLYLFALIISIPAFISKFSELGVVRSILTGTLAVALLQAWTPWTATTWNTPLWAVSVEAFCYFLFPFAATRINRLNNKTIFLLAIAFWILALIYPTAHVLKLSDWMIFVIYAPIFHVPQFLIGVCTGILFLREINNELSVVNQTYQKVSIAAAACFLIMFAVLANVAGIPYEILNNGLFSPLFSIIIFALAFGKGLVVRFLSLPIFILLGEASYAIYLLQNPVLSFLKVISNQGEKLGFIGSNFFDSSLFLAVYLMILISISLCAFFFIEKPLRNFLVPRLTGHQSSKPDAAG